MSKLSGIRIRATYLGLAIATILLGLVVHLHGAPLLPDAARDVFGDALWAVMLTWWISALLPRIPLSARAITSTAACWAVELSQLYHTPLLDSLRRTLPGHLVLGSGFDLRDFGAYALGVLATVACERWWRRRTAVPAAVRSS